MGACFHSAPAVGWKSVVEQLAAAVGQIAKMELQQLEWAMRSWRSQVYRCCTEQDSEQRYTYRLGPEYG
jgi:hypothetical protein